MKTIYTISALLFVACDAREPIYRSYCGCTEAKVAQHEKVKAFLTQDTLHYSHPYRMVDGDIPNWEKAIVCNSHPLDSLSESKRKIQVYFTGETFKNCHADKNDEITRLVHIHDIVMAPKGFDEL